MERAIELLRNNGGDPAENERLIALAQAGKIKLGVLDYEGASLPLMRNMLQRWDDLLANCDEDDRDRYQDVRDRIARDISTAEHAVANPVVYATKL